MFSENHIVSLRQMKRLLVVDLFAATSLVLAPVVCRLAGTSGIFAIAAGCAAAGLFAFILIRIGKNFRGSYGDYCKETLGKWGGAIFMALYCVRLFLMAAMLLAVFAQIVNHTFLTDIPRGVLGTALLLLCVYAVFKGLETRARMGELLFYLAIVPILVIVVLSLPQVNPGRLWPITFLKPEQAVEEMENIGGVQGFAWASVITFSMFSVIEWLLFLKPYVRKTQKAAGAVAAGLLWPAVLNIVILCVCIGIFSVEGMNRESWPVVILMQIVRFPGGFLSRQDGLMLAFWMTGMFMLIGGNIYYGMESLKRIHQKLCKPWMILFPSLFILVVFLGIYLQDATRIMIRFMTFIYMPLAVISPLILWLAGHRKKLRESCGKKDGEKDEMG